MRTELPSFGWILFPVLEGISNRSAVHLLLSDRSICGTVCELTSAVHSAE